MVEAFTALWEAWRKERHRELADPNGILSITSINYLDENPISIPDLPGRWSTGPTGVTIRLEQGDDLADEHSTLHGVANLGIVRPGAPRMLRAGRLKVEVFSIANRIVVRPRDPETEALRRFRGTPAFAPDRRWVVEGRWHPYAEARSIHIESAAEPLARDVLAVGEVEFELAGEPHRLIATEGVGDPGSFTLRFRDATSGIATYGPVRELIVRKPETGGPITLDFNRTQNKNCAYTDFAICPLPPSGNLIDVSVEAGERIPYEREVGGGVTISPETLAKELELSHPPVLLDVRWRLDRPDGYPEYLEGHLPGAVYVDLDKDLASHGEPGEGRHPLPSTQDLQSAARRWGINDGDEVVVYDNLKSLSAGRAWWLLRAAGIGDVRILDGGYRGWVDAGLPTETVNVAPDPGDVVLEDWGLPVLTIDEAADFPDIGVLLDARAVERYRGETEPIDPRPGHIPGAINRPTTENVGTDGRFLAAEELREKFAALGITADTPVAVYCGSGVTASHEIAALAIAGIHAKLYPGSWSQWSNHPERPAAIGDPE